MSEESGWKLVHGDVFRPPRNLVLLSAVVGTGAQLALLILLVIIFAIIGMLYIGYVICNINYESLNDHFILTFKKASFIIFINCKFLT